jgi:DNA-binding NtrC family response regulator
LLGVHDFPGNIRELRAMIFDAVSEHQSGILSLRSFKRAIRFEKMPRGRGTEQVAISFSDKVPTINQALELLIVEVMKRAQGNQTIAARLLGITPQGLGKRLKKLREGKGETLV